jgi:hypothetical protein
MWNKIVALGLPKPKPLDEMKPNFLLSFKFKKKKNLIHHFAWIFLASWIWKILKMFWDQIFIPLEQDV